MSSRNRASISAVDESSEKRSHRAQPRHVDVSTWLGAGAITFGLGAAVVAGAGAASADSGSGDAAETSQSSTSESSGSNTSQTQHRPARSESERSAATRAENEDPSPSKSDVKGEQSAGHPSRVGVDGPKGADEVDGVRVVDSDEVEAEDAVELAVDVDESAYSEDREELPAGGEPSGEEALTFVAPAVRETDESTPPEGWAIAKAAAVQLQPVSKNLDAQNADPISSVAEAQWGAYVQQFRDVDPEGRFWSPADPEYYSLEEPQYPDQAAYDAFIVRNLDEVGTRGFTQNSAGTLVFTNIETVDVGILWGQRADINPTAMVIVQPGQTVTLPPPGSSGANIAIALLPGARPYERVEYSLAAIGYPPFTDEPDNPGDGSSPIPTHASDYEWIKETNAVLSGDAFNTFVNLGSNFASLAGLNAVSKLFNFIGAVVTGYSGNLTATVAKGIQALGGGISASAAAIAAKYASNPIVRFGGGVVYLAGAAVTTWAYVLEQASYIDHDYHDETWDYIVDNPGAAAQELGKATVKVGFDLASAAIGAFGGLFKAVTKWPF